MTDIKVYKCGECGAPDCGNNLGIYLCGTRGRREMIPFGGGFVQSEECKKMVEWRKENDYEDKG